MIVYKFCHRHFVYPSFKICNFIIQYVRVKYCFIFRKFVLYCVGKRGETLRSALFTIVALIIAIPFLFMLPLGLSRRGKIVALVVSLLLSLLAFTAKSVFPLWQLSLLLLLLAVAMTYLLDRQFGHVLYAAAKEEEEDDVFPFEVHDEMIEEEPTMGMAVDEKMTDVEQDAFIAINELPLETATDIEQDVDTWSSGLSIREDGHLSPLSLEEDKVLTESLPPNDDVELLENDEDIQFLEHRELLDEIIPETEQKEADSFAQEERLFGEAEETSLLEVDESDEQAFQEENMIEPLLNDDWLPEWHPVDEQTEEAMAVESLPDIEPVSHTAVGNISPLRTQIVQSVVTELQLSRKYVDKAEYEQRILQCLQSPLSDQDYYVFARLLTEHYLLEKEYDKLASWLTHLQEKFAHYPILLEEIQFIYHTLMKS
jgi:hypothetical protein